MLSTPFSTPFLCLSEGPKYVAFFMEICHCHMSKLYLLVALLFLHYFFSCPEISTTKIIQREIYFLNHFIEVWLTCHIYILYIQLLSLEICVHLWNRKPNLCHKHIHFLQIYHPTLFIVIIIITLFFWW